MFGEVRHAREQILKAKQGANLFIKRKLVADHAVIARCAVEGKSVANDILNILISSIVVLPVRVVSMQNANLFCQAVQTGIIAYDIVSQLKPFGPWCLLCDDAAYFCLGHSTASNDCLLYTSPSPRD